MKTMSCRTIRYHFPTYVTVFFILFIVFMTSCNGVTYENFISQEGDPLFSFKYPSNYYVVYEPPLPSDDVFIEIVKKPFLLPQMQIIAVHIDEWGTDDTKSILDLHLLSVSRSDTISDFKILKEGIILVNGIEAQYVTYSYIETAIMGMRKFVVFNHNGFTWTIDAVCGEHETEQMEEVFEYLINTFKFLD